MLGPTDQQLFEQELGADFYGCRPAGPKMIKAQPGTGPTLDDKVQNPEPKPLQTNQMTCVSMNYFGVGAHRGY
ncbi:hypothetical protein JW968_00450 [Candidatus Woesearchaeota archaeon]|nr:hypothetical protein [Candidatus Woesearchaeota archaeon]